MINVPYVRPVYCVSGSGGDLVACTSGFLCGCGCAFCPSQISNFGGCAAKAVVDRGQMLIFHLIPSLEQMYNFLEGVVW